MENDRQYDAKNMMHTFRLLFMAGEIAREKVIKVRRPDREFLLEIRSGKFTYEFLVEHADELSEQLTEAFDKSDLPDIPDSNLIEAQLVRMRKELYK